MAAFVALFLVVVGLLAFQQVTLFRQRLLGRAPAPQPRRLTQRQILRLAIMQLGFALALTLGYGSAWTFESVGIRPILPIDLHTVIIGEGAFLALCLVYVLLLRLTVGIARMRDAGNVANLRVWPRGRAQKWIAGILIMGFNPFTEEIVMRGVLIHQWGALLGSPVVPIVVGALLNAALHLYQGWRMTLWHALFFTTAVALLYSPWGLGAAIVAHVFGDVLPIVSLRRSLRRVRKDRRNMRMARAS